MTSTQCPLVIANRRHRRDGALTMGRLALAFSLGLTSFGGGLAIALLLIGQPKAVIDERASSHLQESPSHTAR